VADDAFASFERKWLDANPEQAAVLVFLSPDERRRASAFGTLVHELAQTTFGVRETQVAAAKLSWWRQELSGTARHPVTRELFADTRARAIETAKWVALIDGALSQLDSSSASDFAQMRNQFDVFYNPVAAIENELTNAGERPTDKVANLWMCSHFLKASGSSFAEHFSLPLDLFARHAVARETSEKHNDILRDFIGEVRETLQSSLAQAPHASVGCRVRARSDLKLASDAIRSRDPALSLTNRSQKPRLRHVWWAWQEARAARRRT
jgi:phytoene synthase